MAEEYYDLVISGIKDSEAFEAVLHRLNRVCKKVDSLSEASICEAFFLNRPVRIQYQLSHAELVQKQRSLEQYGLLCDIELALSPTPKKIETPKCTCQACGHVQEQSADDSNFGTQYGVDGTTSGTQDHCTKLVAVDTARRAAPQKCREEEPKKAQEMWPRERERKSIRQPLGVRRKAPLSRVLISASIVSSLFAAMAFAYMNQGGEYPQQALAQGTELRPLSQAVLALREFKAGGMTNGLSAESPLGLSEQKLTPPPVALDTTRGASVLERVVGAADAIQDVEMRVKTLSLFASKHAKNRDHGVAELAFARALESLPLAKDQQQRQAILEIISGARIDAGQYYEALAIARMIADPYRRDKLLLNVVQAQFRAQNWDTGERILGEISRDIPQLGPLDAKAEILSSVAKFHAIAGHIADASDHFNLALANTEKIEDPSRRVEIWCVLVKDQLETGDRERSRQVLERAEKIATRLGHDQKRQSAAFYSIALTRGSMGDFHHAKLSSEAINDAYTRAQALKEVADLELSAGDADSAQRTLKRALEASRNINDATKRMDVLTEISAVQLRAAKG
jgi:tetratricopeptide (TPR) repeat protein